MVVAVAATVFAIVIAVDVVMVVVMVVDVVMAEVVVLVVLVTRRLQSTKVRYAKLFQLYDSSC